MENLHKRIGTTDASITNRIQDMRESWIYNIRNRFIGLKKNVTCTKHPGNLGHYEKTKPKNNRNKRRLLVQRLRKIIEEKFPNLKKRMPIEDFKTPNR